MKIEKNIWLQIMNLKDNGRKETTDGICNTLSRDDLNTILATADFFGATETDMALIYTDLTFAKYRVFDWLAMGVGGRIQNKDVAKVFAYSFIKVNGVPSKFIEDLQTTDYDVFDDWKEIILDENN